MSFVPSQSLSKLLCSGCKKYLSHFPIYFHPERGSFCGRCPKPDDAHTVRNGIYEQMAQTQKFPCCYYSNGCTENLIPSKIPQHEKYCPYKKYDCPTFCCTGCKWYGLVRDLPEHFENKHVTFFLKDARFELDFITNYTENCLMPFGEDLFIVNRSSDCKSDTFSCNVSYLGTNPVCDNYLYKIILDNEKKSHAHTITNKLNVESEIAGDSIRYILNNPSSIVATIEIFESGSNNWEVPEDSFEEEENSNVNYEMLKELECLVCFEYMLPPIYQCLRGHSICHMCKNDVDKCPTCEQDIQNTQNFTLAQIINHITFPCKNKRCKFTAKAIDIKQHEANCIYGGVDCPLKEYVDCREEVVFTEIYDHIVDKHYEHLLEMETITTPFEICEDLNTDQDCYILRYGFRLFKLHYKYQDSEFIWAMQLIGPAEESTKHMFEIDIVDNSGKNLRAFFRAFCGTLSDSNTAFNEGKPFIFIKYDQIKAMITTEFTYRVRISVP